MNNPNDVQVQRRKQVLKYLPEQEVQFMTDRDIAMFLAGRQSRLLNSLLLKFKSVIFFIKGEQK